LYTLMRARSSASSSRSCMKRSRSASSTTSLRPLQGVERNSQKAYGCRTVMG
jgi:hypothetical protein